MSKKIRLDKFLCEALGESRKDAKNDIRKAKIIVNGQVCKRPEMKVSMEDEIYVEGTRLKYEEFHYYMFHKPANVVTATKDNRDKTVMDFINEPHKEKLFPVGRLDKDTEGLLIITDDGVLAHELLSPKKHVNKVYYAKVTGRIGKQAIEDFKDGIDIGNGERAKPSFIEILSSHDGITDVQITISEGKYHQVKRMVKAIGSEVLYLKRLAMGNVTLDDQLEIGSYRKLTQDEIRQLKESSC